jgi:PAS domain S-box-containing protein
MAMLGRAYQRKWKEKQKQKDKKQVTVMLSKEAYAGLIKEKEVKGHSFSRIIDKVILNALDHVTSGMDTSEQFVDKLISYRDCFEDLLAALKDQVRSNREKLRQETAGWIQAEATLRETEESYRFIFENSYDVIFRFNFDKDSYEYLSPAAERVYGYRPEDIISMGFKKMLSLIHRDDLEKAEEYFRKFAVPRREKYGFVEYRFKHKKLGYRWISNTHTLIYASGDQPIRAVGITRDIHKQKLAEISLQKLHRELESIVQQRTESLEEANSALRLMLRREEEVKAELEDKVLSNLKELALPYLGKLKTSGLNDRQKSYADMLQSSLDEIVSPFLRSLSSKFVGLTHMEIQVSDPIKHGKTTKEIAELLNLSTRTIEFHRANIRKKVGLKNEKTSLRSYLQSMR